MNLSVRLPGADPLCRFYTRPHVGDALVSMLGNVDRPARILDLASGAGALSMAAARRWGDADLVTVDLDPAAAFEGFGFKRHRHVVADALDADLPDVIASSGFDLALCNPPYRMPRWRPGFERILGEAGLADAVTPATASAEVLFVAQNLRLCRVGGRVGLLVPDGLVSGRLAASFRKVLLREHRVESVVQLPRGAFLGTDARAFIMVLEKGGATVGPVALRRFDRNGRLGPSRMVSRTDAEARLDFDYHAHAARGHGPTLRELGAAVVRGSIERPHQVAAPAFHTTDFPKGEDRLSHPLPALGWFGSQGSIVCAEPGDILMARVDRNLERKVCGIASGSMPISASIFRVRVPFDRQGAVLRTLLSVEGARRLAATARGVGARMLGKEDLLDMSLPL